MSHKAFLALIRLGIGNAATETLPKRIDWNEVECLAKKQGMLGIVYDGVVRHIESTGSTDFLPLATKLRWIGEVIQGYEQRYIAYRKAVADLSSFYHAYGYKVMLLKGLTCGLTWPRPEHRPYGDIDIYLFGQYKSADAVLSRKFGIKIDHSHHHHTVFEWEGFVVENHYDFVNVHVHRSNRELERLFKCLAFNVDSSVSVECGELKVDRSSSNLHALFLIRHMMNHFTGASMNLRQVMDWGFFVKTHGNEIDWPWLIEVLEKYHMKDFFNCVNAICTENLCFDSSIFPYIQCAPLIKERILRDSLTPEFEEKTPNCFWKRVLFKYRRWKANGWKRELCYDDGQLRTFLGGVWNHLLKPAGI